MIIQNGNNYLINHGLIGRWALNELGQEALNAISPQSFSTNVLGLTEQSFNKFSGNATTSWSPGNATVTDRYAVNPLDGNNTASRVTTPGGTGYLAQINGISVPAGTYTLSIYARSNTGSSQTFTLGYFAGATVLSGNLTATTSWQQFSFTFTAGAAITQIYVVHTNTTNTALDLVVYGPKLEAGSVATPYIPGDGRFQMGAFRVVDSGDPVRSSSTGIDTHGGKFACAIFSQQMSFTAFTLYVALRWTTASSTVAPVFNSGFDSNQLGLAAAFFGTPPQQPTISFAGQTFVSQGADITNDNVWHILTAVYDGTNFRLFIDNMDVGSHAQAGLTVALASTFMLGCSPDRSSSFPGNIAFAAFYNTGHNTAQVLHNLKAIQDILAARSVIINDRLQSRYLLSEGDSLTAYSNLGTGSYFYQIIIGTAQTVEGQCPAQSGSTIVDLNTRAPADDALFNANRKANVLTVLIGTNDLSGSSTPASYFSDLKTYCLARRAAGWKIVVGTVPPTTRPGFNVKRNAANALIYGDNSFYDALADIASDPTVGPDAAASNTTYYPDGTHPSAACTAIWAPYFINAVQSIY